MKTNKVEIDKLINLINGVLDSVKIDCQLYKIKNGTVRLRELESNSTYRDSDNRILSNKALIREVNGFLTTDNKGCYPKHTKEESMHIKHLINKYVEQVNTKEN